MELRDIVNNNVRQALVEDIGTGDLTAELLSDSTCVARVFCRDSAVICGNLWFEASFRLLSTNINVDWHIAEGDQVKPDTELCQISGPQNKIVTAERTALNFLQFLSGTATITRKYVDEVRETGTRILDTRKTIPGFRHAQKYAVQVGGGENHRMGLYDAVLIKENHISALGSIAKAVKAVKGLDTSDVFVEVEVESLSQLEEVLACQVDRILLDNFDISELEQAVRLVDHRIPLEASGGVNLDNVQAIAETGVDYISVGALTKDVKAIDLSLIFD